MDEPRWVSELPYTSLVTLLENVNQLPLCMASLLTCLSLFCVSLHMAMYICMIVALLCHFLGRFGKAHGAS